jgi:hypothetical protein
MYKKAKYSLIGLGSASVAMAEEAASPDVTSVISDTISNANTVLGAAITIGGVVLAWKFVRKFFGKTG